MIALGTELQVNQTVGNSYIGSWKRERKEREGVVREGSMKGLTLSKFSKHEDDLVKRKWLPGQRISLNTNNMVEIGKAC